MRPKVNNIPPSLSPLLLLRIQIFAHVDVSVETNTSASISEEAKMRGVIDGLMELVSH